MKTTRRDLLKLSLAGLTATAGAKALPAFQNPPSSAPPTGEIKIWITNQTLRFAAAPPVTWRQASGLSSTPAIVLNPDQKFQDILGFGAAITDAACFTFDQLSAPAREALFHELFHPSEMGLNVCRTCMGASDYSTRIYSYDEGDADPELVRFSIDHDREYILPILREARSANPDLFLFSSPWSPPGWMKAGGSMLGGSMRHKYLANYAQYFLKFLQAYAAEGVAIQAVTPQNEIDTDQDGRMPACIWPQEYEMGFVRNHLGPLLAQQNLSTEIWILDHNYDLWGRAICELDDPELRRYANAVAWHGYAGEPEMMSKVHDAHPDARMHWTEGGSDYASPDYLTDWTKWGQIFSAALHNWCRSITAWNFALDEQGRPNIGPFSCGGLVTIHSQTKEITRSGQYWAFAHFSRNIRRGARRFDSQGTIADVDHIAFENSDGQRVLVITNAGPAKIVTVQMADRVANVSLDTNSLTTLVWS